MAPPVLIIGLSRLLLSLALPRVATWTAPLAHVQGSGRHIGPRMSGAVQLATLGRARQSSKRERPIIRTGGAIPIPVDG